MACLGSDERPRNSLESTALDTARALTSSTTVTRAAQPTPPTRALGGGLSGRCDGGSWCRGRYCYYCEGMGRDAPHGRGCSGGIEPTRFVLPGYDVATGSGKFP